ncbi:MAG: ferredoxin-dependent glutamate synthase, partial [Cyanobacteriota bacterium]
MKSAYSAPQPQGLYHPEQEHDACGVGFIVQMKGKASHEIVESGLTILVNLEHRGACGCEPNTGDGAGILMQVPHQFIVKVAGEQGITIPEPGQYAVGNIYGSPDPLARAEARKRFNEVASKEGLTVLGWRDIPTDNSSLGETAKASEPFMQQVYIARPEGMTDDLDFERKLYALRKLSHGAIRSPEIDTHWYVASLSSRTLVYKGMLTTAQVGQYYPELHDPEMESALALVHSRFSTNTFPSWERSHPYRYIAHNGEINTMRGNVNWMQARQALFESPLFGEDMQKVQPAINVDGSDSTIFDNALELLYLAGRSLPHAVMMMIPEPWTGHESMSQAKKDFYQYHACLMEPWDGPASIAFTNGKMMGAVLDRNGLRPSRYYVTKDDLVIMASEAGVLPIEPERVVQKGRLQPGRMFLVDMEQGRIIADEEIKQQIVSEHPYGDWVAQNLKSLADFPVPPATSIERSQDTDFKTLRQRQLAFGYTFEELRILLAPMGRDGVEAIGSMGADTPLAVLSDKPKLLYNYFQQLFAQVTNPPIDSIREEIITSPETTIGSEGNLLDPRPESARLIRLKTPILTNEELSILKALSPPAPLDQGGTADQVPLSKGDLGGSNTEGSFQSVTLDILFDPTQGETGLKTALDDLFAQADQSIANGINLIILSDRQ